MASTVKKTKSVWFCSHCGNEYSKWMGRCPACGEWNTLVEREVVTGKAAGPMSVPGPSPVTVKGMSR